MIVSGNITILDVYSLGLVCVLCITDSGTLLVMKDSGRLLRATTEEPMVLWSSTMSQVRYAYQNDKISNFLSLPTFVLQARIVPLKMGIG